MNWYKKAQSTPPNLDAIKDIAIIKNSNPIQTNFFFRMLNSVGIRWENKEKFAVLDNKAEKTVFGNIIVNGKPSNSATYILDITYEKARGTTYNSLTLTVKTYIDKKTIFSVEYNKNQRKTKFDEAVQTILSTVGVDLSSGTGSNVNQYMDSKKEEFAEEKRQEEEKTKLVEFKGLKALDITRLTRIKTADHPATEMYLFINRSASLKGIGYAPVFIIKYLETGKEIEPTFIRRPELGFLNAKTMLDKAIDSAIKEGYVVLNNPMYIPEGADKDSWDFSRNRPINADMLSEIEKIQKEREEAALPAQESIRQEPFSLDLGADADELDQPIATPIEQLKPKRDPRIKQIVYDTFDTTLDDLESSKNWYLKKESQVQIGQQENFEGYFSGNVPEYAEQFIGTPSVDASQISGSFRGTSEAIQLVNMFSSEYLKNIAFIFNFAKGGAFGVYVPALDKAIKTNLLKRKLEQKGYEIQNENNMLVAYPKDKEADQIKVDEDIKGLWQQIESGGGTAIGLNVSGIVNATNQNVNKILSDIKNQDPNVPSEISQILTDILGTYHLAATIVHEAAHSKGAMDEGPAEAEEAKFRQWAQTTYVNPEYKKRLQNASLEQYYTPLSVGHESIHAQRRTWYKSAQFQAHMSGSVMNSPTGSDIQGRYNTQGNYNTATPDWTMLLNQQNNDPMDRRLDITRSNQEYLASGLSQGHDIIEEQLRKQTAFDSKPNVKLIMEELLEPSRDESIAYTSLEMLLENQRPRPLMVPISKGNKIEKIKSSSTNSLRELLGMTKQARKAGDNFMFGWMNNLDISDGSSIPGLGDRVMAWDDRDEDFAWGDKDIRSQPRYNPEYDIKGFYYRWIEPRFKPQLFDDMTQDYSNISPAKRFAQTTEKQLDPDIIKILQILKLIEQSLLNNKIKATRIVTNKIISEFLVKMMPKEAIMVKIYDLPLNAIDNWEDACAIWFFNENMKESDIDKCENYFQDKDVTDETREMAESTIGIKEKRNQNIQTIITKAKEICKSLNCYEENELHLIGEYPRKQYTKDSSLISKLEFASRSPSTCQKIGYILMDELEVFSEDIYESARFGLTFVYKGIQVDFSKSAYRPNMKEFIQSVDEENIKNPLIRSALNKDFTINTLAINIITGAFVDVLGRSLDDIDNKTLSTVLDSDTVIKLNPTIIVRAIAHKLAGYELDQELTTAIIANSKLIMDDKYNDYITYHKGSLLKSNKEDLYNILKNLRLDELLDYD